MAMVKIGKTYYSGQPKDVYLICGNTVRDGETFDAKGNDLGKVTVAAQEHEDGNTLFVRLCGWRGKAKDVAAVRGIAMSGPMARYMSVRMMSEKKGEIL